ncbi:MAG: hypothetical protein AAFN11_03200 [Chloroflexota bacterium]
MPRRRRSAFEQTLDEAGQFMRHLRWIYFPLGVGILLFFMSLVSAFASLNAVLFTHQSYATTATITNLYTQFDDDGDPEHYISYRFERANGAVVTGEEEVSYRQYSVHYYRGAEISVHYHKTDDSRHIVDINRRIRAYQNSALGILAVSLIGFIVGSIGWYLLRGRR